MRKEILDMFYTENIISSLSVVFFIVSLFMGLISIYSAVTMNTEKRRREVAIRKVNGATIKNILILFFKIYVWLWTGVCVVMFPLIYIFGKQWIDNFNQRISLDIGFFLSIYITILALILLTVIFRILNIARKNPIESIRKE